MDHVRATEIAVGISRVLGIGFVIWALFAVWLGDAGRYCRVPVPRRFARIGDGPHDAARVSVSQCCRGRPSTVMVDPPATPGWSGFAWDPQTRLGFNGDNGRPVARVLSRGGRPIGLKVPDGFVNPRRKNSDAPKPLVRSA